MKTRTRHLMRLRQNFKVRSLALLAAKPFAIFSVDNRS